MSYCCYACGSLSPVGIGVYIPADRRLPPAVYRLCSACCPPSLEMLEKIEASVLALPDYSAFSFEAGNA